MANTLKILVADNDDTLDLAAKVLAALGHEVALASDGMEALRQSVSSRFDLLLLKSHLPVLSGPAALTTLRSAERAAGRRPLPTVMVTATDAPEETCDCMAAGADACAMADHMETLLYTIDRVLRVRSYSQA